MLICPTEVLQIVCFGYPNTAGQFGGLHISIGMNKIFDSINRIIVGLAIVLLHLPDDIKS